MLTVSLSANDSSDEGSTHAVGDAGDATARATVEGDSATQRTGAALAVTMLLLASSGLGLVRDLSLAALFGASSDTDAFLVAWTIPETVSVLLMEGAMSFLLVPVFVAELTRTGSINRVVRATLLPFVAVLTLLTIVIAVGSPVIVDLMAPGIVDRPLAIRCVRVAAWTVLFMGMSGYLMAALRAHKRFARPASTYVAYNLGILVTMWALHSWLGVYGAALGLAIGSALMVLVQLPVFLRMTSLRGLRLRISRGLVLAAMGFIPIAVYSSGRHAQVLVERVVGSTMAEGSISYMNYASKIAQMPSLFALSATAVAFPSLAKIASDRIALGARVDKEVRLVILLIMPFTTFLIFFAEPCVALLYQRGAFTAVDSSLTAEVMRIYSLGLPGQVLVATGAYVCFSRGRPTWTPALAAVAGLVVTVVLDVVLARYLDVRALAVGNAGGITLTALLVWLGIRRRIAPYHAARLWGLLLIVTAMAAGAACVAWLLCLLLPSSSLVQVVVGAATTLTGFLLLLGVTPGFDEPKALAHGARSAVRKVAKRVRSN